MLNPSAYYPDYFSSDLGVESHQENPLSQAIKDSMIQSRQGFLKSIASFEALHRLEEEKTGLFHMMGLTVSQLSSAQKDDLYHSIEYLVQNRNKLSTVRRLAEIYFGDSTVEKGFPYRVFQFSDRNQEKIHVNDSSSKKSTLFIRVKFECSQKLVQEFNQNIFRFLDRFYDVKVSLEKKKQGKEEERNYSEGIRL